jgi:DNA-binding NtrC family response regulator
MVAGDCYLRSGKKGPATIMASSSKLHILYGEGDSEVLATQAVSIQKAGHQVETAVGRKGVEEAMRQKHFDLVVLGPTLTRNDRHHLPYMVKKNHAETRVLVMHCDGERHPQVDATIDTGSSMEVLVQKIATAFAPKTAGAAAGK